MQVSGYVPSSRVVAQVLNQDCFSALEQQAETIAKVGFLKAGLWLL
jgi:hypothetical protein